MKPTLAILGIIAAGLIVGSAVAGSVFYFGIAPLKIRAGNGIPRGILYLPYPGGRA